MAPVMLVYLRRLSTETIYGDYGAVGLGTYVRRPGGVCPWVWGRMSVGLATYVRGSGDVCPWAWGRMSVGLGTYAHESGDVCPWVCTLCGLNVYSMCTQYVLNMYSMYTQHVRNAYRTGGGRVAPVMLVLDYS